MKQVLIADNPMQAYLIEALLESQGITAEVSGDASFDVRGEAPATPEILLSVWVPNDADEDAALEILRHFRHFFPPGVLEGLEDWYEIFLLAKQELPLYPPAADSPPVYRLLHLPSFQRPSMVRLTGGGDNWRVVHKPRGGRIVGAAGRDLTRVEAKQLNCLLEQVAFWDMASTESCGGNDGTHCVFEGVCGGRYHVVDRWSPRGTPYAILVEFLLGL